MNWLDVAVLAVLVGFALRGLFKGLVFESLGFLGLLIAAAVSLYANPAAADLLRRTINTSRPFAAFVAAILVFLAAEFIWLLALYFLLGGGPKEGFRRSGANWVGGALFGLGKGAILASLLLLVLAALPMPQAYRAAAEEAQVAGRIQGVAPWLGARVAAVLPRAARHRYEAFRHEVAQLGARWRVIAPKSAAPAPPATTGESPASPQAGTAGKAKHPAAKPRP